MFINDRELGCIEVPLSLHTEVLEILSSPQADGECRPDIKAIKLVRNELNCGLYEAKEFVDLVSEANANNIDPSFLTNIHTATIEDAYTMISMGVWSTDDFVIFLKNRDRRSRNQYKTDY